MERFQAAINKARAEREVALEGKERQRVAETPSQPVASDDPPRAERGGLRLALTTSAPSASPPTGSGRSGQGDGPRSPDATLELLSVGLALVWVLAVLAWALFQKTPEGLAGLVMLVGALMLPLAMLGLVVILLRQLRALRGETAALTQQIQALRHAESKEAAAQAVRSDAMAKVLAHSSLGPTALSRPVPVQRETAEPPMPESSRSQVRALAQTLARIQPLSPAETATATETLPDQPAPTPAPPAPSAAAEEQPALALATATEALLLPIATADVIRAVQFPESAEDVEGFAALRRVLADRTQAKLIRAAQDVLTLLAQEGVYMDNLAPDRARPELWRRFAQGERGRSVAALGGIRDRSSLALTGQKMREDPVFRDAAHHFLRSFDRAFVEIEPRASDEELGALGDTRTARAFMLIGRVAGTFD